jgi:hypothetical protein
MSEQQSPRPEPFWQASGLDHGHQAVIRWQGGRWSGPDLLLRIFLIHMSMAGRFPEDPEQHLPPDVGNWTDAAEEAAKLTFPGPLVVDSNFAQTLRGDQVN